eukprot:gnl/MRDRNA2_/MRDRNA2_64840_c0_seq3.p1 gnl/MRDRNA2_/MRDRNA2_64840_c0~~gnl/MRDRNA2_/MRDRNA2_64840_c0_seq3.p1  ORF type:complete len:234 (-),score=47.32 gnl/MRDRNA2_/MRDRNA2_64840_c0_seq3:220-921(-)
MPSSADVGIQTNGVAAASCRPIGAVTSRSKKRSLGIHADIPAFVRAFDKAVGPEDASQDTGDMSDTLQKVEKKCEEIAAELPCSVPLAASKPCIREAVHKDALPVAIPCGKARRADSVVTTDGTATCAPSKACDSEVHQEVIEFFKFAKGYGFIRPSSSARCNASNVFFHIKALQSQRWLDSPPEVGEEVMFQRRSCSKGVEAFEVIHASAHIPLAPGTSPYIVWSKAQSHKN